MALPQEFIDLLEDRTSGSTELLLRFTKLLDQQIERNSIDLTQIRDMTSLFTNVFSAMKITSALDKIHDLTILSAVSQYLKEIQNLIQDEIDRIYSHLLDHLGNELDMGSTFSVITFSNSYMIQSVLEYMDTEDNVFMDTIYVLESQPGGEGKTLYNALQRKIKFSKLQFILDRQRDLSTVSSKQIITLVGCDSYAPGKGLVNKIGSSELIRESIHHNIPVFALCNPSKVHSDLMTFHKKKQESGENHPVHLLEDIGPELLRKITIIH